METVPEEEPEINPRTGLPFKQSAKLRAQKMAWRNKNADVVNAHIRKWQLENRDKMNEYQYKWLRKRTAELKYLKEIFSEALQPEITTFTVV